MSDTPVRLLRLLSLLQARRDWPGGLLADRLEVSARTVRRDVERLREMGYRIRAIKGPDGGYRLEAGSELPPLLFDDDQAVALAIALQVAAASGVSIGEAAMQALTTVRQVMPARLRHRIDAIAVKPVAVSEHPVDAEVLVELSRAVKGCDVLRFDYTPVGSPATAPAETRHVEPHHVVANNGQWYLVSWDLDRCDWRVFRVDRITPRATTGRRFTPRSVPGGDVGTFLLTRFQGSHGTAQWPCTGEVVIDLPARHVAPYVPDGIVEELDPERCRLVTGSWSWTGLAAFTARFDAAITVIGPPKLAAACQLLADRYREATASPRRPAPQATTRRTPQGQS